MTESAVRGVKRPFESLADEVLRVLRDGVRHGHFEISIIGTRGSEGSVAVIVKAARSHRFVITDPRGQ